MLRFSAANLDSLPGVAHAFFGRKGGVSPGIYASLNCGPGSSDQFENVIENRRRALAHLSTKDAQLLTLYQVHGADAVRVTEVWEIGRAPRADAMITTGANIALGILTADCVPILFADRKARVIAAAHAGWKGALAGIVESTLAAMEQLGARREHVAAAIGPCISQGAYEVGEELRGRVLDQDSPTECFFVPSGRPGHWLFDLSGYVSRRLEHAGVRNLTGLGLCTYAREAAFYSYRRATHRGENDYGRQLSVIVLT